MKSKLKTGILFLFFAIPGVLTFVFSSIILVLGIWDSSVWVRFNLFILLGLTFLGAVMTLIGIEKIKQWLYIAVFLSFPIEFYLTAIIGDFIANRSPFLLGLSLNESYKAEIVGFCSCNFRYSANKLFLT
jgi:hypothetical protein